MHRQLSSLNAYHDLSQGIAGLTLSHVHACLLTSPACPAAPLSAPADQYQPYLGMPDGGCLTCDPAAVPRYTSDPGADYCTEPYYDTACPSGEGAT